LQILGIIEIWHDPFELLDTVPTLFFAVVTISKTFCTIYALPQMHEYCLSPKSDEEEQIQNSHALYGRKIGYAYTGDFNSTVKCQIFGTSIYTFLFLNDFESHITIYLLLKTFDNLRDVLIQII
ncbi:hypothetical protein ALC60_03956, partial [Trachymyrmex zeteki]